MGPSRILPATMVCAWACACAAQPCAPYWADISKQTLPGNPIVFEVFDSGTGPTVHAMRQPGGDVDDVANLDRPALPAEDLALFEDASGRQRSAAFEHHP